MPKANASRLFRRGVGGSIVAGLVVAAAWNTSLLAPRPEHRSVFLAQRGVHQVVDDENADATTCTALSVKSIDHRLIDNTLPSIAAAFEAGADVVEVDVRQTKDGHFVLFHDDNLDCRTNGRGRIVDAELANLKRLDVAYGYSPDHGRSYPLRGAAVGAMPTLEEALQAFPDRVFMIQFKTPAPGEADAMVRYLERRSTDWRRLIFFGAPIAVERLRSLRPQSRAWADKDVKKCTLGYLAFGWTGYVPQSCRGGMIVVPVNLRFLLWGWPNRFVARMRDAQVGMLVVGELRLKGGFARVDTEEQFHRIPEGFGGYIWTDRMERIGPLISTNASRVGEWPSGP
jgi:glycerophosphoryl diester phosphodiesterase